MDKVIVTMVFPNNLLADTFLHWLSDTGEQYLMEDVDNFDLVLNYNFAEKKVYVDELDE